MKGTDYILSIDHSTYATKVMIFEIGAHFVDRLSLPHPSTILNRDLQNTILRRFIITPFPELKKY